jgi:hypothetical protein
MGRVLSQLDESGVRMWNAVSKKVVQAKNLLKSPRKGTENEKKNPKAEQVKKAKKQLGQYGISSNSSSEGVKKYKSLKSSAGSSAPKTSKLSGAFCDELVALLKDTPESNETLISKLKGLLSEVINENALGNWSKSDRSAFIKLTAALGEDGAFFNRGDWNEFSVVMRQHSEIQKRLDATNLKKKNNMAESPIGSHGSKHAKQEQHRDGHHKQIECCVCQVHDPENLVVIRSRAHDAGLSLDRHCHGISAAQTKCN